MGEMITDIRIVILLKSTNLMYVGTFQGLKCQHFLNLTNTVSCFDEEEMLRSLLYCFVQISAVGM